MKNDLIRDRFIIGINDEKLREQLLQLDELTLESLISIANITIKKEIEFVPVAEIKIEETPNEILEIIPEKLKKPIQKFKSLSNKPLEPLLNRKCHKCNETFRSPNYLFQHILLVHSLKFLCKICKAKFHSSDDLTTHVNIYHKPGHTTAETTAPISSNIHDPDHFYSSDDSSDDSSLPADKIYTYPYMCEICAKIIKNPQQLAVHKLEHAGIKPYLCTVCGLKFKVPSSLRYHEMVHTGEKPFNCGLCKKSFARRCSLKGHMWRIHKVVKTKKVRKDSKKENKTNFEPATKIWMLQ